MLSEFVTYFRLGASHIADVRGYDHILFLVALTSGFGPRDWRRLLWLVTAFTLGHSITLVLATLGVVLVNSGVVELLIAATIVATGLYGLAGPRTGRDNAVESGHRALYAMAGVFGLVHGLGFSGFLRTVLGAEEQLAIPLLAFNVGLEIGQLAIVGAILAAGALACDVAGLARRRWSVGLCIVSIVLGAQIILERATS